MKTCRFIRKDGVTWVPSPDSWLGGWTRQRWLERYFSDIPVRSASAAIWADMSEANEVHILCEVSGKFTETSLKKFRDIEKKSLEKKMVQKFDTYFCDIDGTIFKYRKFETYKSSPAELTPGALEKLTEIKTAGHMVVLTTARPEDLREHTLMELEQNSVPFDRLIMGLARGPRHLINDMDPNKPGDRAIPWNLNRDEGMSKIDVKSS